MSVDLIVLILILLFLFSWLATNIEEANYPRKVPTAWYRADIPDNLEEE